MQAPGWQTGQGGIVHLIVATTVPGCVAMSLKALTVGKEPRDPTDWRTAMAALQQDAIMGCAVKEGEMEKAAPECGAILPGSMSGRKAA